NINNSIIEDCDIYENAGWGIHKYPGGSGNIIRNNRVHNNASVGNRGVGILSQGGSGNWIYNNIVYGNATGVTIAYESSGRIYNNTIYDNNRNATGVGPGTGIQDLSSGTIIQNNVVYNHGNVDIDGSGTYSNNWVTSSGSPGFVNAGSANFHLLSNSFLRGAALNLTSLGVVELNLDFDRVQRPATGNWDIGAYQYGPALGFPPPVIAINSPSMTGNYVTSTSTQTISGSYSCSGDTLQNVSWINDRLAPGTATVVGTTWSISNAALMADRVNRFTITVNCTAGQSANAIINIRANGANRQVLALSFDENKGTTAADSSPSKNDATFSAKGNTWMPGPYGSALSLDGSGGPTVANNDSLALSTFTISMWVNPTSTAAASRALLSKAPDETYFIYGSVQGWCQISALIWWVPFWRGS